MHRIQTGESLRSIRRHIDPGNAPDKSVPNESEILQGREKFDR